MEFLNEYWFKIAFGLSIVSTPFFIAALKKKISWQFFISWTLTSVFVTFSVYILQSTMQKHLDEKTILWISILLGLFFAGIGFYLRSIPSINMKKIGWLFIIFGFFWIVLSI